ncbi:MAG TPA: hypothetical protein DCG47_03975 [Spirochaetaceae bacterium]|nr:hypothetical protein [Spirochaetaceae bacterium]
MKKKSLCLSLLCLFLLGSVCAWAQGGIPQPWEGQPAWLHLEQGKQAYARKDFGPALVSFDRAISTRRIAFSAASARLSFSLEAKAARKAAGSLQALLDAFAAEDFLQREYQAIVKAAGASYRQRFLALKEQRISDSHRALIEVLLLVLEYKPLESLKDSLDTLGSTLRALANYPEAELWKGRVFLIEGELAIAERQLLRAFDMREALDIPEESYSILYELAELYALRGDALNDWERIMDRIVQDERSGDGTRIEASLQNAMRATLLSQGIDRFLTLYRLEPGFTLRANKALAEYYLERGRPHALIRSAIAVNMILTRAIALLRQRDVDYVWSSLDDFLARAGAQAAVRDYIDAQELERMLLVLADALYVANARQHAQSLWTSLAAYAGAPYASLARQRLVDPTGAVRRAAPAPLRP